MKLMAFWRYDQYPYVLGGEVEDFASKGNVKIKGYDGFVINPIVIYQYEEGKAIKDKLESLAYEYHQKRKELLEIYKDLATHILPSIKRV
jgi:hypothetical protein